MKYKSIIAGGIIGAIIGLWMILQNLLTLGVEFDSEVWFVMVIFMLGIAIVGALLGWVILLLNKKTNEWKIGAIIGFAIGIFSMLRFFTKPQSFMIKPSIVIVIVVDKIFDFIPAKWGEWGTLGIAVYVAPIIYTLIGTLTGFLISIIIKLLKIKRKIRKK